MTVISKMAGGAYYRGKPDDFGNPNIEERERLAIEFNYRLYEKMVKTVTYVDKPEGGCICCGVPCCVSGCEGFDPKKHPHISEAFRLVKKD